MRETKQQKIDKLQKEIEGMWSNYDYNEMKKKKDEEISQLKKELTRLAKIEGREEVLHNIVNRLIPVPDLITRAIENEKDQSRQDDMFRRGLYDYRI